MNFMKRAYLHTIRKKGKTLLMLVIILVIATLIQTCISIRTATEVAVTNVRKSLSGSFTINAKQVDGGLNDQTISDISNISGVKKDYNLRCYTRAKYVDYDGKSELEIQTEGASEIPEGCEHAGKVVANSYSEQDTYFTEAGFKVIDGSTITNNDKHVALIHHTFANKNQLELGDSIYLENLQNNQQKVMVKIIGIFTNETSQDSTGIAPSYDLYENIIFTDLNSLSQIEYTDNKNHYQYADFYVDDPEQLEKTIQQVKTIPNIDWKSCIITKYDADYQNAKQSLQSLRDMLSVATIAVIIASVLLLALILSLWIRQRIQEIGAFLAMGISKSNILFQQIAEIFIIALAAFILSFGSSSLIAQHVGDGLVNQSQTIGHFEKVDMTQEEHADNKQDEKEPEFYDIDVKVTISDWIIVCMVGTAIILSSVLVTAFPIMNTKPKDILVQMD